MNRLLQISAGRALASVLVVAAISTAVLCQQFDGQRITNDASQAASVTRHLLAGDGLSTGILFYDEHFLLRRWPAPQTVFPPGFPALTAGLCMAGMSLENAAFTINAAGFLLIPVLICAAGLRIGLNGAVSVALAALWLCFPTNWRNAEECQTEMMFILFTLGSLLLLTDRRVAPRDVPTGAATHQHAVHLGLQQLVLSGLCAGIACTMRYAGVFWLVTAGVVLGIPVLLRRVGSLQRACAFFAAPVLIVGLMFLRNQQLVGDLKGGNNYQVNKPLATAALNAYYALSRLTGLDQDGIRNFRIQEMLIGAGILLLAAAVLRSRCWRLFPSIPQLSVACWPQYPDRSSDSGITRAQMIWLYLPCTACALLWLEKTTSITLSARMFLPLIPFALLATGDALQRSWHTLRCQNAFVLPALALLLAGIGLAQRQVAAELRDRPSTLNYVRQILDEPLLLSGDAVDSVDGSFNGKVAADETPKTVRDLLKTSRILTSEAHMLSYALTQDVVGLTPPVYSSTVWTPDKAAELVHRYRLTHVVIFPEQPNTEGYPLYDQLNSDPASVPWLTPVVSRKNLLICRVDAGKLPVPYDSSEFSVNPQESQASISDTRVIRDRALSR